MPATPAVHSKAKARVPPAIPCKTNDQGPNERSDAVEPRVISREVGIEGSAAEQDVSIRRTLRVFVGAAVVISPPLFRENRRLSSICFSAQLCATWVMEFV